MLRIVSGSWDNTIKISAITTGQLLQTLTGHTGVVYSLVPLDNGQIVSGSIDGSIKIWYTNSKHSRVKILIILYLILRLTFGKV